MSKKTKKSALSKTLTKQRKLLKKALKQQGKTLKKQRALESELRLLRQLLEAHVSSTHLPSSEDATAITGQRSPGNLAPITAEKGSLGTPVPLRSGTYKTSYLRYKVASTRRLTPTMVSIKCIPAGKQRAQSQGLVGEYMRVLITRDGSAPTEPTIKDGKPVWGKPSPVSRKYTIRRFWPESGAIELGIVIHDKGPGSTWAQQVQPGDPVHFLGPRSGYDISDNYDYYLLAGDETGLPGMARWIESMPATARGHAFIEIPSLESAQNISTPEYFQITWVIRKNENSLYRAVTGAARPDGNIFMWLAGESRSIHPLRLWMRSELKPGKGHAHSKGYWKSKS